MCVTALLFPTDMRAGRAVRLRIGSRGPSFHTVAVRAKIPPGSIHTAIQFLLDAYDNFPLIAKYNNPTASCYLSNSAQIERKVFEVCRAKIANSRRQRD